MSVITKQSASGRDGHARQTNAPRRARPPVMLSDQWLDDLKSRVNIVDVVSEYVPLKPKGRRFWGCCPFHNEKTPSFSVDAEAQFYYCFGCHKGGNVIHFVMEMERMEFMDAVGVLAERAHLPLPERGSAQTGPSRERKERVYEANLAAARHFHSMIWTPQGASALAYLHRRGLDDSDIRRFGLGATGDGWESLTNELTKQGFEEDELVEAGLTVRKETRHYDMFRERVIFPIINAQNRVLGFGGRAMGDAQPKYLNTPDSPVFNKRLGLYAMNFVRKERQLKRLILVEGYMDVVSLRRAGVPGVVATLGTALTEEQARLIKRYAPEVWVGYDGDSAGQKAIDRALDIFDRQDVKARVLVFPDEQDPDDFIRANGAEGFDRLKPIEPVEYRMKRIAQSVDLREQEGRTAYAIGCCDLLKKVGNPVELELYVNRLMIQTGFTRDALMRQIGVETPRERAAARPSPIRAQRDAPQTDVQRAEKKLLMLLSGRLIPDSAVCEADFTDPLYREMAKMLLSGTKPSDLLDRLDAGDRERAAGALSDEVRPDEKSALAVAEDCLNLIRRGRVDDEIGRLREEIRSASAEDKLALLKRLTELMKTKA